MTNNDEWSFLDNGGILLLEGHLFRDLEPNQQHEERSKKRAAEAEEESEPE